MAEETDQTRADNKTETIVRRAEDFASYYANNVVAESTAWDMRLTFGRFDNEGGQSVNNQQVSVAMSFGLAKLMLFWIETQIIAHELETGAKVRVRADVIPPEFPPLPPELQENPQSVRLYEEINKMRERWLSSMQ